ncbi:MAG: rod shape-determining protein RodA [Alistipes sp.]|nr:rod shape-determining protein RodA [Candidatus Alistipes equi]
MTEYRNNARLFEGIDWLTILIYVALTIIGFLSILSTKYVEDDPNPFAFSHEYMKQIMWIGISWIMGFVILLMRSSIWHKYAFHAYGFALILILMTFFIGKQINGARAWIVVGPLRIQPMEIMKIAIGLTIAKVMSAYNFSIERPKDIMHIGCLIALPVLLAILQNDTGSGLVLFSLLFMLYREGLNNWICIPLIFMAVLFLSSFMLTQTTLLLSLVAVLYISMAMMNKIWKIAIRAFAATLLTSIIIFCLGLFINLSYYYSLLITCILSILVIVYYAFRTNMKNLYILAAIFTMSIVMIHTSNDLLDRMFTHQKERIVSFLGLKSDPRADYNVIQSKIAIGSGGLFGKGYMQGTQTRYGFVPERHTDFIFCSIGEEFGLCGATVVLLLLFGLIYKMLKMADKQRDTFGRVYCCSVASILLFHTMINVGMTIGLVPVMGIPLPFVSYGGSSMMTMTILVFIAFNMDASTRLSISSDRDKMIF